MNNYYVTLKISHYSWKKKTPISLIVQVCFQVAVGSVGCLLVGVYSYYQQSGVYGVRKSPLKVLEIIDTN